MVSLHLDVRKLKSQYMVYRLIQFISFIISLSAIFLPWWEIRVYTYPGRLYIGSGYIHLIPPSYVSISDTLKYIRVFSLDQRLMIILIFVLVLTALNGYLSLGVGLVIKGVIKSLKKIYLFATICSTSALLLFVLALLLFSSDWPAILSPYGYFIDTTIMREYSWGFSYGFYLALVSCMINIINLSRLYMRNYILKSKI